MKLSILICHLPKRIESFKDLILDLNWQKTSYPGQAEILVDEGPEKVGLKRQRLLEKAEGEYVCFVDDDDKVAPYYVKSILSAIESGPDCAGIVGIYTLNGQNPWRFEHSIRFKEWGTDHANRTYLRTPNHLNPIKRELALKAGFNSDMSFGEDHDFSNRIRPFLNTEIMIEEPIYFYFCRSRK